MNICRLLRLNINYLISSRSYAVKNVGGSTGMMGLGKGKKAVTGGKSGTSLKTNIPVETDVKKLVNYVCGSNINIDGKDVELKPDNEYPDWLWTMRIGAPLKLSELDPNTKEYWLRVRALAIRRKNKLLKFKERR